MEEDIADIPQEETSEDRKARKAACLEILSILRAVVAEGEPAYDRMAARIEAAREAEIDSLLRDAGIPE